jgi:hypothetical protein
MPKIENPHLLRVKLSDEGERLEVSQHEYDLTDDNGFSGKRARLRNCARRM